MLDILSVASSSGAAQLTGAPAFFGYMGVSSALIFANMGAAYGTARSGVGISSLGVLKPELIMKSIIPVVMAGILGIYGMIVSVILCQKSTLSSLIASQQGPLRLLHRLRPPRRRHLLRPLLPRRRTRHRHRRRRRRQGQRPAGKDLRWHDPHSHFRRGPWTLRSHRRPHPLPAVIL